MVQALRLRRITGMANSVFTTRPKTYLSRNTVTIVRDGGQVSSSALFNVTHLSKIGVLSKANGAPAGYQAGARSMRSPLVMVHRFKCTGVPFQTRSWSANTPEAGDLLLKLLETLNLASSFPWRILIMGSISGSTTRTTRTLYLNIVVMMVARRGAQVRGWESTNVD